MNTFQPDPEWFKRPYSPLWKKHAENVKALYDELLKRFPKLKNAIKVGLGALSDELLKMPPEHKNEPDLTLFHKYKVICHIEISGSEKVRVPPSDIWIRPGKITLGLDKEKQGEPYWFYMVYPNNTMVLRASEAESYLIKTVSVSPYGKKEVYCQIPYTVAHPKEYLFRWIEKEIS